MPKAAERRARKVPAPGSAHFPRRRKLDDNKQRQMLELWLYASLKLRQLAGGPDVGFHEAPPSHGRRLRRGTA